MSLNRVAAAFALLLGIPAGLPQLEGRIHSVVYDTPDSADHPLWSRLLAGAAVAAAAATAVMTWALAAMIRGRASRHHASPLTYGLAGFGAAHLLHRKPALVQVWKIDTSTGRRVVRIAVPPGHARDVRTLDAVACWGRGHRDGTFRAYRALNRTTGEVVQPAHVSPLVIAGAALVGLVLVALVLASL